jgi:hypothetical protein
MIMKPALSKGAIAVVLMAGWIAAAAAPAGAQTIPVNDFLFSTGTTRLTAVPAPLPPPRPAPAAKPRQSLPMLGMIAAMVGCAGLMTVRLARRDRFIGRDAPAPRRVYAPNENACFASYVPSSKRPAAAPRLNLN